MKTKTLFYMALSAVMTTLAACSQDDEPLDAAQKPAAIEFEITDGGYGGDEATRAKEEGFRTKFEAGDNCGLYIVRGGSLVASNVILTAEEGENGTITWKAARGISGAAEGDKYFLCYPPSTADMENKVNPSATDSDDTFFASIINGWNTADNQNDYANYRYSDLKTAAGEVKNEDGKLKVSFSLNHKMALAVIEVPKTVYKFTDTSIPDYTVASSVDFSSDYKPFRMEDGTYRFVFNPKLTDIKSITGTVNGNKNFTIALSNYTFHAGKYKRFRVDGGTDGTPIEKEHELQVGDYLMKDGNLVGKDDLSDDKKADVAAIVFSVGHNQYDLSDYSATGIGKKQCHGYAVALQDATSSKCIWGVSGTDLGLYPSGSIDNQYNPELDWSGYAYTQTIIKAVTDAGGSLGSDKAEGYPATYYAVNYSTAAPANSTGWFLPSVGQMKEVCTQAQTGNANLFINDVGVTTRVDYWTSSEFSGFSSSAALYVKGYDNAVLRGSKNSAGYSEQVRPVLAF